ncbi:MAG: carbohydrate ABC transporter permease [Actinobacteria bacterium]|nr:carbohydrate ABC transporter permease [Actinomycetota bacterium]
MINEAKMGPYNKRTFRSIKYHIILIIVSLLFLIPFFTIISISLRGGGFTNYIRVFGDPKVPRYFINSILIAVPSVILVIFISSLGGFAFSKLKFPGKNVIFYVFLTALMLPSASIIVQLFVMIVKFKLVNNYLAVILPVVALILPFALLIIKNYMDDIPNDIVEAALIDGCTPFSIYWRIIFPLSLPALSAVTIFTFLFSWNEYMLPLVFLKKTTLQPLTLLPRYFLAEHQYELSLVFAGFTGIVLPVLILYIFFQKYFIEGLTAGAIK